MGFGFITSHFVKGSIKDSLQKNYPGTFTNEELDLAADLFERAGDEKDLPELQNEDLKQAKAVEIAKRIKFSSNQELALKMKFYRVLGIA